MRNGGERVRILEYQDIRVSGHRIIRISEYRDVRSSRHQSIGTSDYQDIGLSDHKSCTNEWYKTDIWQEMTRYPESTQGRRQIVWDIFLFLWK